MTIVRLAELEIDLAQLERYKAVLAAEIETSVRVEPGVLALSAVSLRGEPTSIRILEVYADQEAYEGHLQTPHFTKYKADTAGMIRTLTLLEADAISLNEKPKTSR